MFAIQFKIIGYNGNAKKIMSQDWIDDCLRFYGKVLNGKYAHWCPEWDDLPIDETCEEFKCCLCFLMPKEPNHEVSDTTKPL